MELAWKRKNLTVKSALFLLKDQPDRAYTTVMTVLNRLVGKGFLQREKSGRIYVYTAALEREAFLKQRVAVVRKCLNDNFKKVR